MLMNDRVAITGIRRTNDGYLVADARVARTGIQIYAGREVDPDNVHGMRDRAEVRVYRPEAEVFDAAAMRSYAFRPVTLDHPAEAVTADNWRAVAVGQTGADVVRDGDFVRVPLVLMDAAAIAAVESGKRQLSMGYSTELTFQDGKSPDGVAYDAIQKSLRMNHLAVVAEARGGPDLTIGDETREEKRMADAIKTRAVLVDGLTIETTDQGAEAIALLQGRLTDAAKAASVSDAAHDAAIASKDAALAAKDAEIDALKASVLDAAALDARVASRSDLIAKAKAIAPAIKTDGLGDDAIRKAAVAARLGDAVVAGKAQAYIDARFDILAEADPIRSQDAAPVQAGDAASAHDKMISDMQSAWKGAA